MCLCAGHCANFIALIISNPYGNSARRTPFPSEETDSEVKLGSSHSDVSSGLGPLQPIYSSVHRYGVSSYCHFQ